MEPKKLGGSCPTTTSTRFHVSFFSKKAHRFPKEDNIRLDKPLTRFTFRNTPFFDDFFHFGVAEWPLAFNTVLSSEASMRLDYLSRRNARSPFQGINVLSKT